MVVMDGQGVCATEILVEQMRTMPPLVAALLLEEYAEASSWSPNQLLLQVIEAVCMDRVQRHCRAQQCCRQLQCQVLAARVRGWELRRLQLCCLT
jgi:EAL domain-containing protein (putative c-di-GMP-specific phosphodiesterase class I)